MRVFAAFLAVLFFGVVSFALPPGYKGKPFKDQHHQTGAQVVPGTVELALYDMGGEGVAYHDTTAQNEGSAGNHITKEVNGVPTNMCRPGTPEYVCFFRENEGVDVSYLRDFSDFAHHTNMFEPKKDQHYIGWQEEGEWANYTVNVKAAGVYTIKVIYSFKPLEVNLSLENKPAAVCKLPVHTESMHRWNRAECGEITFPSTGLQLLTVYFHKGINLASFELVPKSAGK